MPETKGPLNKHFRAIFWTTVVVAAVILIVRNIDVFGNVLKVVIGFGAVVIIHEFGHFIIAKLSGIRVEAFSLFMPPTIFGVRRTKDGFKFRFLPGLHAKKKAESGDEQPDAADEKKADESEGTEYRVGLIPFGGFVKMLGQDDIGPVKKSDDPRSFANKSVAVRAGVIAGGVVFNTISAVLIFMVVFLVGIKRMPPLVGGVNPGSPAERAGLKAGDEIIEIAGKSKSLELSDIMAEAALSDDNEAVPLKVRHKDGSVENYSLVAEPTLLLGMPIKAFGIYSASTLTIGDVSDPNELESKTGFRPGDRIKAVNGKEIKNHWELENIVQNTVAAEVTLLAERPNETGESALVESKIGLELVSPGEDYIYSIVPRMRMEGIEVQRPFQEKIVTYMRGLLERAGIVGKVEPKPFLKSGDIMLSIGDVTCPTRQELREVVKEYGGRELPIKVLRTDANGIEESLTINVRPKYHRDINEVAIGITSFFPMLDARHPVVATTVDTEDTAGPEIPRGATITAVGGVAVSNFYDVIREIRSYPAERVTINWRLDEETTGKTVLDISGGGDVKSTFAEFIPFEPLERLYKATGPIDAIAMGYRKTILSITQTYLTLKRLITGMVSPKNLKGPVGILDYSYQIVAQRPLIDYVYWLAFISVIIAVFNFLPVPPLDGGLIVLMLIEKIKGSALSERTQGIIAYTGLVLIGGLVLYVTFNDIVSVLFD